MKTEKQRVLHMGQSQPSVKDRMASVIIGDVSDYGTAACQQRISAKPMRDRMRAPSTGRIYSSVDFDAPTPRKIRMNPLAPVSFVWGKIRSIGEYDAQRTR